ncbi:MAG: hypothetical protein ACRD96_06705, partial [Bryobacteraceae bacterium]
LKQPPERPVVRFHISPEEKTNFAGTAPAISPDGRRVAFVASGTEGRLLLWMRPIDSLSAASLAGTEEAFGPFWSPDSRFVAFFAGGKLKKVEVSGGPPQTLCDTDPRTAGTWNADGDILFGSASRGGLRRVSSAGGPATPVTTTLAGEQSHSHPRFLPNGRDFLYLVRAASEQTGIYAGTLDSKDRKRLVGTRTHGDYAPAPRGKPGHLLFERDGTLMAQAFDAGKLALSGDPFPVAERVGVFASDAHFSVSANGVLAYRGGGVQASQLAWHDREGKRLGTVGAPFASNTVALSPDGTRAVVGLSETSGANLDLWLIDLARNIPSRFTFDPAVDWHGVWSPDGTRIVFASTREGPANLYQKASSGAGNEERLLPAGDPRRPQDWSRDGRYIVFSSVSPKTRTDLWVLDLKERKPIPYLQTEFDETLGQLSPDGRWMAYVSNESGGQQQVFVQPFPASGGKWQISSDGGSQPRWRRDGKELFYVSRDGRMMAVEIKTTPQFQVTVPKALFQSGILDFTVTAIHRYDVAPDGRFLIASFLDETASSPITVVMNWQK